MKSIEQLKQLATNPFYKLTDAEALALKEAEASSEAATTTTTETTDPKKVVRSRDNAAVKQTGKLNKHATGPASE